ncbi:MAG: polyketide cyclase [Moritella sp.]|uniref:SRPBCC family protein n=1 Tax=Moritella sp. TaxID=78556 RepID=UPI000C1062A3|nr:SRPBCC family protein [Moritella sp.]MBL1415809.1 SRPBCC family protein [Moritella sp.]MCJ8297250.1 polyketide cyclase [Colwellia sp.]PHR89672.1 MAG: polyketide cyclase [Moritella sp.]
MIIEESIEINSTPRHIFSIYKNVSNWHVWDKEVKESSLKGSFIKGSSGSLTPSKGPKSKIELSEVEEDKSFTVESKLPFCVMHFEHNLISKGDTVLVTHRVRFKGLLSFVFRNIIGKKIKNGFPITLKGLKSLAEK